MRDDGKGRAYRLIWNLAVVAVYTLTLGGTPVAANDPIAFDNVLKQAKEFIQYHASITLTPEQEAIKRQALSGLPAPCCSKFSAETCCCVCNLARTTWGLSKFLITEHGYHAAEVQEAVTRWFRTIGPNGFSGRTCFNGGCERPFRKDGCGGMKELKI